MRFLIEKCNYNAFKTNFVFRMRPWHQQPEKKVYQIVEDYLKLYIAFDI